MNKPLQVPAILTSISNTKDGGKRLGFRTNELSVEEKVLLEEYFQSFGFLLFKSNEFKEEEVPTQDADDERKSPSQRLRARMFVYWKEKKKGGNFDIWYSNALEAIGQSYHRS